MTQMWESFYEQFITYDGYKLVLQGLQNTMKIALIGLVIGIFLGTLVAVWATCWWRTRRSGTT